MKYGIKINKTLKEFIRIEFMVNIIVIFFISTTLLHTDATEFIGYAWI
jgi:hypothetical protein